MKSYAILLSMLVFSFASDPVAAGPAASRPNIVLIYADDLGYGDVSAYGASKIKTPQMDRLAADGLRFTDGHATSATCTPSRFALLTGQYPWRVPGTGVLPGDAGLIIKADQPTLPGLLRSGGYRTGVVGKWHVGLGKKGVTIDWNGPIAPGAKEVGFDESFLIPATGDRVPCVYVENGRVAGLDPADPIQVSYSTPIGDEPTGKRNPELLKMHPSHGHDMTIVNGVSRIGYMKGGKSALWVDEDMADVLTNKAVDFIKSASKKQDGATARPFFLYLASHDIHVPRIPHPRFVGKSGMGPRGDAILQFDDSVGRILNALESAGVAGETLVILSSDNGPVVDDGYKDDAVAKRGDHRPAGPWRGGKYSLFEGGTRVPFLVSWPGKIKPGVSDALVCQVDLFASLGALTGQKLSDAAAPDSQNILPALLGESPTGRSSLVVQANGMALRDGSWKFIPARKGQKFQALTGTETGVDGEPQLYNLANDPGERENLAKNNPEEVKRLAAMLEEQRVNPRTRP